MTTQPNPFQLFNAQSLSRRSLLLRAATAGLTVPALATLGGPTTLASTEPITALSAKFAK